jgi:DNA-binding Lrp family transcriptional regulator
MPIYTETIIKRWFGSEKNLSTLNGIVHHKSDKQIARETGLRIDRVSNYRSKLKKKGLLTAGFFSINHENLGLVQVMDFPREFPSLDDVYLTYLVRISRPFGYLRLRLLPPAMVEDGYHLGASVGVMNYFSTPFVIEDFRTQFETLCGQAELHLYEKKRKRESEKIDLLSIYICKEVQKGKYGARTLASSISEQITEDELGIQPSISNVNRRVKQLKEHGTIRRTNPLNLVPLKPYYNLDSAIVKKNDNFHQTLAVLAELNVMVRFSDILNEPDKAYIILEYHFSQKWDMLGILKKYLGEIIFFDHAPRGTRRTIPFEYFKRILSEKKHM